MVLLRFELGFIVIQQEGVSKVHFEEKPHLIIS